MELKSYLAEKSFYKKVALMAIPLSLQQLLGSAMEMIDSLMVSWIGMVSAVGSASQIIIIANTITWGILSGTNIFTAQFFGKKDTTNLKKVFGYSLIMTLLNALFWFTIISLFSEQIIRFYINDEIIVENALKYMNISRFSLFFEAIAFTLSFHYRSCNQANTSLVVSIISMITNIVLNYVFIFGALFIPAMNVEGAALATMLAQILSILIYFIHGIKTHQVFMGKISEIFLFDSDLLKHIYHRVYPLIINETLFGFGCTLIIKAIGGLGSESLEAYYIGDQIAAFFSFIIWGFGGCVQIMISHELGKGKIIQAIQTSHHFELLAFILATTLGLILWISSPLVLALYHIQNPTIYLYTKEILLVFVFRIIFRFFNFTIFSILKSGGDSKIIPFLDCGVMFVVAIPLAFLSVYVFNIKSVAVVYFISQTEQLVRFIWGLKRLHKGNWAKDLTRVHG